MFKLYLCRGHFMFSSRYIHENGSRPQSNPSHSHDGQIANETRPVVHKPPSGDEPPGRGLHNRVDVIPVQVRHGADVVGNAESGGHEVSGRVGGDAIFVDVDEEGTELMLIGVAAEPDPETCFDFGNAGEVVDATGAEAGEGVGREDLLGFRFDDVESSGGYLSRETHGHEFWLGVMDVEARWMHTFGSKANSSKSTTIANRLIV